MPQPLFIQIHTLTSYPGSLLNRDDVGFAKRLPFGGTTRTRISSQCLKRHWRTFTGEHSLSSLHAGSDPVALSVRSRHTFERFVLEPLVAEGVSADLARAATEAIMIAVLGESAKAKKAKEDAKSEDVPAKGKKAKKDSEQEGPPSLMTGQLTVLGKPELDFFLTEARALAKDAGSPEKIEEAKKKRFTKDWGKNLDGLRRAAGLDGALFGRMVTSDKLARADAAVHVAHALTVHSEHTETDYFAAVDDLLQGGDDPQLGSAHIGTTELTSGLFYGYVVVDVAQLVSNLEGCDAKSWMSADRKLAADVVSSLIQLVARVSPGAKKGSTAPYAYAHLTLVEAGSGQPRTLANAFLKPITATAGHPDLVANAYSALTNYVTEIDQVFGLASRRAHAAIGPKDKLAPLGPSLSVDAVAKFGAGAVVEHA
jgi:CRISPR system Cascade subunit CasC